MYQDFPRNFVKLMQAKKDSFYNYKWTKILTLEVAIFGFKMIVNSCLENFI